eukprot:COSAG01_NODE_3393_length_6149_cov_24.742149_5_plen_56_part_00
MPGIPPRFRSLYAGVRSGAIDIGEFAALLGDTSTDANWRRRPAPGPSSGVDLALQ